MAVITYSLTYRDGAISGSPVNTFKIIDDASELPSVANLGDLAFAKNQDLLYFRRAIGWDAILVQYLNSNIRENVIIQTPAAPLLGLTEGNGLYVRLYNLVNSLHLSTNARYDAGIWVNDTPFYDGLIYVQNMFSGRHVFYISRKNAAGDLELASIDGTGNFSARGAIFEKGRSIAAGYVYDVPFSSGNFVTDNGTFTIVDYATYSYSIVGNMMTLWFNLHGTLSGTPSVIQMIIPAGANTPKAVTGNCIIYDIVEGWKAGRLYTNVSWTVISVNKLNYALFAAGDCYVTGTFTFPIVGV